MFVMGRCIGLMRGMMRICELSFCVVCWGLGLLVFFFGFAEKKGMDGKG